MNLNMCIDLNVCNDLNAYVNLKILPSTSLFVSLNLNVCVNLNACECVFSCACVCEFQKKKIQDIADHEVRHQRQKRPAYMAKETYIHAGKRDLPTLAYMRYVQVSKETYDT